MPVMRWRRCVRRWLIHAMKLSLCGAVVWLLKAENHHADIGGPSGRHQGARRQA